MNVMDFEKFKQINDLKPNYGEIEEAEVVSNYTNKGCGDGFRIFLKIKKENQNEVIEDARFTTSGCGFSIAALSMGLEWIKGKTVDEAEKITVENIETLFVFPERRKNYPESAVEAIRKAIQDYRFGKKEPMITRKKALKILKQKGSFRNENLKQVILDGESLSGIDFTGANLQNAYLQNCNLENAIFESANLRGAYLNSSNLKNANFRNADLRFAKLVGANIENTNFQNALYDIGTRVDHKQIHIFQKMIKMGKDIYK